MPFTRYVEREAALDHCPVAWCRRAARCRGARAGTPCRRTHQTLDEVYDIISDKIEAFMREQGLPWPPPPADEDSLEFQMKYAALKRALEDRLATDPPRQP